MKRIIFGDNQFFGVNHMSETKSQQQQQQFSKLENIIHVIDSAQKYGADGFMLHAHPRAEEICDYFRNNKKKYSNFIIYPTIPHPVKYMELVSDLGLFPAIIQIINKSSFANISGMIIKGGLGLVKKDAVSLMKILIDIEMQPFRDLNIGAVFLQNMTTDLVISHGADRLLFEFHNYINKKYNVEAAFQTANLPVLINSLKKLCIDNPIVMSPINKTGFFMNPSKKECENTIKNEKFRLVPMSVLASGMIPPYEAFNYALSLDNVDSIIFGASSSKNIKNSIDIINNFNTIF